MTNKNKRQGKFSEGQILSAKRAVINAQGQLNTIRMKAAASKAAEQEAANAAARVKAEQEAADAAAIVAAKNAGATPSNGIFSAIQNAVGMSSSNPANANKANIRDLIAKAEQLSKNLQVAANKARATIPHGGKHRNRRTRRR